MSHSLDSPLVPPAAKNSSQLRLLSKATSGKISSGQIITSVASAAKELAENALDAGATAVELRLQDAGVAAIALKDNGQGVTMSELKLMTQAHTTSKIQHFGDLATLTSYGFRGEALHALCQMAQVEIASRTEDGPTGAKATFGTQGAVVEMKEDVVMNKGTTVTAKEIFKGLPVRRKLVEKATNKREQLKKVELLVQAFAIARPQLRISLHNNNSPVFVKQACTTTRAAIQQVWKASIANQLDLVTLDVGPFIHLEMYLPRPPKPSAAELGRANTDRTILLVNERPVEIKSIFKVLRRVFSKASGAASERNPVAVLLIQVASDCVDVNLVPNKDQVMLQEQEQLLGALETKLKQYYGLVETEEEPETSLNQSAFDKTPHNISDAETSLIETDSRPIQSPVVQRATTVPVVQRVTPAHVLAANNVVPNLPSFTSTQIDPKSSSSANLSVVSASGDGPNMNSSVISSVWPGDSSSLRQSQLDPWSLGRVCEGPVNTILGASSLKRSADGTLELAPPPEAKRKSNLNRSKRANKSSIADTSIPRLDDFLNRADKLKPNQTRQVLELSQSSIYSESGVPVVAASPMQMLSPEDMARMKDKLKARDGNRTMQDLAAPAGTPSVAGTKAVKFTRRVIPLKFDIEKCRRFYNQQSPKKKDFPVMEVIGKPEKLPYWICRFNSSAYVLNHHRLEELLLFERLMEVSEVTSTPLNEPINLETFPGWSEEVSACLKTLPCDEGGFIEDKRLVSNGIIVHAAQPSLINVPAQVNFIGAEELVTLLGLIVAQPTISISESRPGKVSTFFTGEAVRIMRQNPPGVDRETVGRLWAKLVRRKQGVDTKCIHGKQVARSICSEEQFKLIQQSDKC